MILATDDQRGGLVRGVLAFGVQSGTKAKKWTATTKNDGNVMLAAQNVLRHRLSLPPITTTTTLSF
jgi:hypothetical protein